MITISLCMIVKNEEDVIARCLDSIEHAVDEIIIVDTGSTDKTKEIASSYKKVKIYDFKWIDNFAAARNFSFSKAKSDYILWLDADDVLTEHDADLLIELKQGEASNYDYISMPYNLSYDQNGKPTYSYRRNRLVKRIKNFKWIGAVHEYLEVYGKGFASDVAISHKKIKFTSSDRNINIYLRRLEAGEEFSPRDQFYFANELREHGRYEEAIKWYNLFLDGKLGWIEDNINACYRIAICYEKLNDLDSAILAIMRALTYDRPRPDFCYQLGSLFFTQNRYQEASFWYQLALQTKEFAPDVSFHNPATATWLPLLQLTVCYDRLKKPDLAVAFHLAAKRINPNHPSIQYNDKYYRSLGLIKDESEDSTDNNNAVVKVKTAEEEANETIEAANAEEAKTKDNEESQPDHAN